MINQWMFIEYVTNVCNLQIMLGINHKGFSDQWDESIDIIDFKKAKEKQ